MVGIPGGPIGPGGPVGPGGPIGPGTNGGMPSASPPPSFMPLRGGPRMGSRLWRSDSVPLMPSMPIGPSGEHPPETGDDVGGAVGKPGEVAAKVLDSAELAEVTVYGIATLYERFPARKKDASTTGKP